MNRLTTKTTTENEEESHVTMESVQEKYKSAKLNKSKRRRIFLNNIRCDRITVIPRWKMLVDGKEITVDNVIVSRGNFSCSYRSEGGGCAGSYYIGEASGAVHVSETELERLQSKATSFHTLGTMTNDKRWRRLEFDLDKGEFLDADTGKIISGFKKLHLMPGCKARYLPL